MFFFPRFFQSRKITSKFNLFILLLFIMYLLFSAVFLAGSLEDKTTNEISSKALLAMEMLNSVREYTYTEIAPHLAPSLKNQQVFFPQAVGDYAASQVVELFHNQSKYGDFYYKEATDNPTNLRNSADPFEKAILKRFQDEQNLKEISGFRSISINNNVLSFFYVARPLAVTKQSCLQCHSTPTVAPKSQIETYGTENGFGWKLNQIVAAQIISFPVEQEFSKARRFFSLVMAILIFNFTIVVLLFNFFMKRSVLQRLRKLAKTALEVSTGNNSANFEENSQDEIGILAANLNYMKSSLENGRDE